MIPSKIGNWNVVDKLGSGGQGFVLRAKKLQLDGSELEAAIKVPISDPSKLNESGKTAILQGLIHEFEMLKLVSSPNVCKVIDSGIEIVKKGQKSYELPWLATELIRGDDLYSEVQKNGPLDETAWAQVSWDIAAGLEAIHSVGATHLDLKPQNVVRHARRAIVIDLGGASFVGKFDIGDLIHARSLGFAAPEQLDEKHDPEDYEYPVDLYSLGATMYFAATGQLLYDPSNVRSNENPWHARYKMMKTENFDTSLLSAEQTRMISDLCRFKPSARISLADVRTRLAELLPDKDIRKAQAGTKPQTDGSSNGQNTSPLKPKETRAKTDLDLGGWFLTMLLCFLPPLIGPFIRYFQLRDSAPKTSERYQLRTLLVVGSLFSFGTLGALAFFHKYKLDKSLTTKITAVSFAAISISFLISTTIGISFAEDSLVYLFMQVVAGFGLIANMALIAPVSAALGIHDSQPVDNSLTATTETEKAESGDELQVNKD